MKKSDYLSLIKSGVLNSSGSKIDYWNSKEAPYDYNNVNKLLTSQLDEKIDYNNIIILFPIDSIPLFYNNRKNISDHITYLVDVKYILESKGVKFKNGESLLSDKYRQSSFSMIIVKDGLAYVSTMTSNPFDVYIKYLRREVANKYEGIHINENDLTHININDLNIMFSGCFKDNHIKNS